MDLMGKVAIITGAGAGIGKATAFLLAKQGVIVCCNSLSKSAGKVVDMIQQARGTAYFFQADVSQEADVKTFIQQVIAQLGKIDILFNNAGIVIPGEISTLSLQEWDRTMEVNVRSVFLMSKYCLPYLKQSQGVIINNSSSVAFKGVKDRAAYTASKGAVLALTKAMAAECIPFQVRVNAICPGTTETPSLERRMAQFEDPAEAKSSFIARQPLQRLGNPQEIAEGVVFLIQNDFCTGTSLIVDGGMTI